MDAIYRDCSSVFLALPTLYPPRFGAAPKEIRLMLLCPGSFSSPLYGLLIPWIEFHEELEYIALSYVWGSSAPTSRIYLNGHTHAINQNLDSALREIRHVSEVLCVWVDAICINQDDAIERNEQVQIMREIYATATAVLIWLGDGNHMSDRAFDHMQAISREPLGNYEESLIDQVYDYFTDVEWKGWFGRVWTMQELLVAADKAIFLCGSRSASWQSFIRTWKTVARLRYRQLGLRFSDLFSGPELDRPPGEELLPEAVTQFDILQKTAETIAIEGGTRLFDLMVLTMRCRASDPRDRMYALLGMLKPEDRERFAVDYRKTIAAVFIDTMRFSIVEPYIAFSCGYYSHGKSSVSGLPSWVPDFSTTERGLRFVPIQAYSACGRSMRPVAAISSNGETLAIEAVVLDSVESVFHFSDDIAICLRQLKEVQVCSELTPLQHSRSMFTELRTKEPLWRVLVADQDRSMEQHAPETWSKTYSSLTGSESETFSKQLGQRLQESNQILDDSAVMFLLRLSDQIPGATFFKSSNGLIGIGGAGITKGDLISIWSGVKVPYVVRPFETNSGLFYKLVAPSYVGGVMDGCVIDNLLPQGLIERTVLNIK